MDGVVVPPCGVVYVPKLRPEQCRVGIFLPRSLLRGLELRLRLTGKIQHFLLGRISLIAGRFRQLRFRGMLLIQQRRASGEVRLHAFVRFLLFFLLLHRLLRHRTLLRDDIFEIQVHARWASTLYLTLRVKRLIGRGEYGVDVVYAGL